jgi:hypothetical protein
MQPYRRRRSPTVVSFQCPLKRTSDGFFTLLAPAASRHILEANLALLRWDLLYATGDRSPLVLRGNIREILHVCTIVQSALGFHSPFFLRILESLHNPRSPQPLIWARLVDQVHPGAPTNTVKRILTSHDFANSRISSKRRSRVRVPSLPPNISRIMS